MTGSIVETPVFFGDGDRYFGILTRGESTVGLGALICLTPDMSENPVGAALARRLAETGVTSFRLDLPGSGASILYSTDDPKQGSLYLQAAECMAAESLDSVVLIAGSVATKIALSATTGLPHLHSLVFTKLMIEDPVRKAAQTVSLTDYLRRAASPANFKALGDPERRRRIGALVKAKVDARLGRSTTVRTESTTGSPSQPSRASEYDWSKHADPAALEYLLSLIDRQFPILMVSGAEDTDEMRLKRLLAGHLPDLDGTSLQFAACSARTLKGFGSVRAQQEFIELVTRWLTGSDPIDISSLPRGPR